MLGMKQIHLRLNGLGELVHRFTVAQVDAIRVCSIARSLLDLISGCDLRRLIINVEPSFAAFSFTSQITTRAPSREKFNAVSFPIPLAPPVTRTTSYSVKKKTYEEHKIVREIKRRLPWKHLSSGSRRYARSATEYRRGASATPRTAGRTTTLSCRQTCVQKN